MGRHVTEIVPVDQLWPHEAARVTGRTPKQHREILRVNNLGQLCDWTCSRCAPARCPVEALYFGPPEHGGGHGSDKDKVQRFDIWVRMLSYFVHNDEADICMLVRSRSRFRLVRRLLLRERLQHAT